MATAAPGVSQEFGGTVGCASREPSLRALEILNCSCIVSSCHYVNCRYEVRSRYFDLGYVTSYGVNPAPPYLDDLPFLDIRIPPFA